MLYGDKIHDLELSENYIFGKTHRFKFTNGLDLSNQDLDYVHADLWGPAQVPSLSGERYFMSIIDDYFRKVWVHKLKTPDQALEIFKVWKVLVETQTGLKVKCLRTDNRLKFCSKEFENFC